MPQTADFLLERLRERGVHRVFGYPGDGINGILGAFGPAGGDPKSAKAELSDPEKVGLAVHGFRQKMTEYYEKLPGRDK